MTTRKRPRPPLAIGSLSLITGALAAACALVACGPPNDPGTGTTGSGGSASGGHSASGGTSASGGASPSGGVSGSGGAVSSGGVTASGGATTAGSGGAVSSSGGTSSASGGSTAGGRSGATSGGGRGGSSSSGGGGGASTSTGSGGAGGAPTGGLATPVPSEGCGNAKPNTGSSGSPLTVSGHQYYVKLPSTYDGMKPFPIIMMFNPTGNPLNWAEQNAGFESGGAKDGAIRAYPGPASMANGWGAGDVSFFMPFYDALMKGFCVDKARVFAAGESSGGDFSSILGCEYANVVRVAVPCSTKNVSQYPLDATKRKCTGQVTAVVIQGKNDNVVGPENGPKTRDFYTALNHCGTMTMPVAGYTDTLSNCVMYQGCDADHPVYWCNHTDPEYSGTNHGWPKFAPKFLWQLFSSY